MKRVSDKQWDALLALALCPRSPFAFDMPTIHALIVAGLAERVKDGQAQNWIAITKAGSDYVKEQEE